MVDIVSMVVLALVKGVLSGAAQEAGADGYRVLRSYLARRYGNQVEEAIRDLEHEPLSAQAQQQVDERLRAAGAQGDAELERLAEQLILLIENPPLAKEDPVEELRRSAGLDAVGHVLDQHVERLRDVRTRYEVDDADLLGSRIAGATDVPGAVKAELVGLRQSMRGVIEQIARAIQQGRYADVEKAVEDLQAGRTEQLRAQRLVAADKRLQISYESLRLTVQFFGKLNQRVLARMEQVREPRQLSTMMFGNAVMIYELTTFVIEFIDEFRLENDLDQLHEETMRSLRRTREKQSALKQRAMDDRIDRDVKRQVLDDIQWREAALAAVEDEWTNYLRDVQEMEDKVRDIHGRIPTLELIRDGAEIQLETLQHLALLRFLRQNSASIRGAVDTLQGLRLAPMTASRVRVLLGIEVAEGTESADR